MWDTTNLNLFPARERNTGRAAVSHISQKNEGSGSSYPSLPTAGLLPVIQKKPAFSKKRWTNEIKTI
jgi:hypothetical protein